MSRAIKPRVIDSSDDEGTVEDVFPGPVCISCSGVDNDPLVWCSGCGDPYHADVSLTSTNICLITFSALMDILKDRLINCTSGFVLIVVSPVYLVNFQQTFPLSQLFSNVDLVGE